MNTNTEFPKGLNVSQANLCTRFYTSNGWTREHVASYLNHPEAIHYVIPRWYDYEKDNVAQKTVHHKLDNTEPYNDCDYFAIYNVGVEKNLDIKKIKKEQNFIPFKM